MMRLDAIAQRPAKEVMARFLEDMTKAAQRTYPGWHKLLADGVGEHAPDGGVLHQYLLEHPPLDDYFFAAVAALEGAKIRRYLPPDQASELLAELAEQADAAAGRTDRVVSDFVFFVMGRIDLEAGVERMKMPYDEAVKALLQKIGVEADEATRPLMNDLAFRHQLGEPLALGIPAWWKAFAKALDRGARAQAKSAVG
ncbi:MAG: hypothetical protein SFV19_18255 [Rhodospirillaceae bacterium]|nr:hypothetical protein [Rhodospirillaceae bacterium]